MKRVPNLEQLLSLEGKRALITGAAAGIGQAIACRFAEAGADLELVDIDGESLTLTRDELACFGVQVNTHIADLSKKESIDRLWENWKMPFCRAASSRAVPKRPPKGYSTSSSTC